MTQSKTSVERFIGSKEGFPTVNSDKSISTKTVGEAQTLLNVPNKAAYLGVYSLDTINLSTDSNNPSFITGIQTLGPDAIRGLEIVDVVTGAIKNNTGRTLHIVSGSISFNPIKSGGVTSVITLFSEISVDNGATWTVNPLSRRTIKINNDGEAFSTKVSQAADWPDQAWVRFRCFYTGGGTVTFEAVDDTVLGGQTITSPSVVWELTEAE